MTRPDVLHIDAKRIVCQACGVFAPILPLPFADGTIGYTASWVCDICRCNRRYATAP
jgi:hypothetical protein